MAILWENLHKGRYIAAIGIREHASSFDDDPWSRSRKPRFDGRPMLIIELSYPFIVVESFGKRFPIDYREYDLTVISKEYALSLEDVVEHKSKEGQYDINGRPKKGTRAHRQRLKNAKKSDRGPNICERCGSRMIERLAKLNCGWRYWCDNCHSDGGPIPVTNPK